MPQTISAALAGLGFGLSLIVAIGSQNAFVLRQGLRKEHIGIIVLICALADALLIAVGVSGLGALIHRLNWLLMIIEIVGGVFLVAYGIKAALRAIRPDALSGDIGGPPMSFRTAVTTVLALTFLNPHVYLDTVLFLGSISTTYGDYRWWFGGGAMLGSVIWFSALGFGARLLTPVFTSTRAWRILDVILAGIMLFLGTSLIISFAQHLGEAL